MLEDLTQSSHIKTRLGCLLQECEAHTESEYFSIDATVKCMMKLLTMRVHVNNSQDCRDVAAIPDSMAAYKLFTVRGFVDVRMLWWACVVFDRKFRERLQVAS